MRLAVPLVLIGLAACAAPRGGERPAPAPVPIPGCAPPWTGVHDPHRLLLIAGEHAIHDAHWVAHRVVARSQREVWFVDPAHPDAVRVHTMSAAIWNLATHPASSVVVASLHDGRAVVFDRDEVVREIAAPAEHVDAVSPDGRLLLTSMPNTPGQRIVEARTGRMIAKVELDGYQSAFDASGRYLLRAGSLVRVHDGAVVKKWPSVDAYENLPRGWVGGRAVAFAQKAVHLIDPVTLAVKTVPYECRQNDNPHDLLDASHAIVLHLCGNRAQLVDPFTARISRVKLPVAADFSLGQMRVRADGTVALQGLQSGPGGTYGSVDVEVDVAKGVARIVDRDDHTENASAPSFATRSCRRWVGSALGERDWCDAEADGPYWLAQRGGSFAIASADRELLRIGVQMAGGPHPYFRLVGGGGLGGMLDVEDSVDHAPRGLRWQLDQPIDLVAAAVPIRGRACSPGTMSNGRLLTVCSRPDADAVDAHPTPSPLVLTEIDENGQIVAERSLLETSDVVFSKGRPITWARWRGLPYLAREWPGAPSTCPDCAPVATYGIHRDFAVRIDAQQRVQVAGTLDPNTFACIDERGRAFPYETCRAAHEPR